MADNDMAKFEELLAQNKKSEASVMFQNVLNQLAEANAQLKELKIQKDADVKGKEGESSNDVTIFSKGELVAATNNFGASEKIGEGLYGDVYKAFLRHTTVAIKVLKTESAGGKEKEFNQEVETLTKVRHPNLVSLIGASPEARALVYEYLPNGNLASYLSTGNNNKKLSVQERFRIASQMCSALIFLHSHCIAHGDLKPENVLLDENLSCKLSDFGLSRKLEATKDTVTPLHVTGRPRGSLAYIDPEFLAFGELTTHSDVFAFGIILMQLVTGKDPRGLRSSVEQAVERGKLDRLVDNSAGNWPSGEALKLAQLGLACSHQMRKKRANLTEDVWPKLKSCIKDDQSPKIKSQGSGSGSGSNKQSRWFK